jgi:hypothetical protein
MHKNFRKALISLAFIASCSVVLAPNLVTAQTTLPTITVVGSRPQSQADIQNILDGLRRPSWSDMFENMLPDFLDGGETIDPQVSLTLYTVNGCHVPQQTRTDSVAREMSILASNHARNNPSSPPLYELGTVMNLHFNDGASERFVVTSSTTSSVVITPVAGSSAGCP